MINTEQYLKLFENMAPVIKGYSLVLRISLHFRNSKNKYGLSNSCDLNKRDACAWSSWSGWTSCNASCGPKTATRTRRRRIESVQDGPGKVGHCSGQIEQSIALCSDLPECQGRKTYFIV